MREEKQTRLTTQEDSDAKYMIDCMGCVLIYEAIKKERPLPGLVNLHRYSRLVIKLFKFVFTKFLSYLSLCGVGYHERIDVDLCTARSNSHRLVYSA